MGITVEQLEKAVRTNARRDIEDREIVCGFTHKGIPFPALLSSWLIGGQTQQGKSVIAAFFVMWFVGAGAHIILLDPHKHNKKRGLFTKIEPLFDWFAREPIDCLDIDELLATIDWLEQEYQERKHSMAGKEILLVVIDEFNEVLTSGVTKKQADRIATVVGNLARGGSKHGVFVIAIGHNFDLASAGGNAVRRNIIGRVSVAAELGEMSNILDTTDRQKIKQLANYPRPLHPGQAIVKVPTWGLYRLNYPHITREYLAAFASFMRKMGTISTHKSFQALTPTDSSYSNDITISSPSTNDSINATNQRINHTKQSINISAEERAAILAAGRIQLQETGGVNRTKLRRDLGWETRYKAYEKIKQVADEQQWPFVSKQDRLDPDVWQAIKERYNNRCVKCGCYDEDLQPDRVVPGCKGGAYIAENVQPLCKSCNSSKREQVIDYRKELV
jgi:hypothetical protein